MNREGFRKILKKYDKVTGKSKQDGALRRIDTILHSPVTELDSILERTLAMEPMTAVESRFVRSALAVALTLAAGAVLLAVYVFPQPRIQACFAAAVCASFVLAWANGANDIANSVGTSVGAGALTLWQAIFFGCIFEFLGAMCIGPFVSKTISKGLIEPTTFAGDKDLYVLLWLLLLLLLLLLHYYFSPTHPFLSSRRYALCMLCVLIGAGMTTLLATAYGFPISATHGVIGGLVAVGLASKGSDAITWSKLGFMAGGWVASPFLGMAVSCLFYLLIKKTILQSAAPAARAKQLQVRLYAAAARLGRCVPPP